MATETTAADAAHGATEAAKAGMPQLDFSTFPNQIFWLLVSLVAIYFVLSRIALPRIGSVLAERRGTITNDIAAAEDLRQQALGAEKAYNDALVQARAQAQKIVAEAKAEIQKTLDAATAQADLDIAAKANESSARIAEIRAGALDAVTEVANDTAKELVAALGGKADARAITSAIAARLKG